MKSIKIILSGLIIIVFCLSSSSKTLGQTCDCNPTRVTNVINNANVKIVASYGSNTAVTSINPGTTYYLRVQATSFICTVSGSGCSGIFSPVAFYIALADGCTVFNNYVPPRVGVDVGPGNSYTAYFTLKTHTGADFIDKLYFRVQAGCFPSPTCTTLIGGNRTLQLP